MIKCIQANKNYPESLFSFARPLLRPANTDERMQLAPRPELLRRVKLYSFPSGLEAEGCSICTADVGCAIGDILILKEQVLQEIPQKKDA